MGMGKEIVVLDFIVNVFESPDMSEDISELRMDNAMISLIINELINGETDN